MRARSYLFLVLLYSFLSPASASDWQSRLVTIAPYEGGFAEFCVPVEVGRTLHIELDAPHALDFNVHFHTETETLFPVRERIEGNSRFAVPADRSGEYCLMWTNPSAQPSEFAVTARYRVL